MAISVNIPEIVLFQPKKPHSVSHYLQVTRKKINFSHRRKTCGVRHWIGKGSEIERNVEGKLKAKRREWRNNNE